MEGFILVGQPGAEYEKAARTGASYDDCGLKPLTGKPCCCIPWLDIGRGLAWPGHGAALRNRKLCDLEGIQLFKPSFGDIHHEKNNQ
jgi:hypothetical protein